MALRQSPPIEVESCLRALSERWWGAPIFVFGPWGHPFWAARGHVLVNERDQLREALDFIEDCETKLSKPFVTYSAELSLTAVALGGLSNLYMVMLGVEPIEAGVDREPRPFLVHAAELRLAADELVSAAGRLVVSEEGRLSWVPTCASRRDLRATALV